MQNAKIFVMTHKKTPYRLPNDTLYEPCQVGAANSGEKLCEFNDAITPNNISKLNFYYGEFTGMYQIAKCLEAGWWPGVKYVGQCHYRRVYKFSQHTDFNRIFGQCGVIAHRMQLGSKSLRTQYEECHYMELFSLFERAFKSLHPELSTSFDTIKGLHFLYSNSGFIMRRDDYVKYVEFAFEILERMRKRLKIESADDSINWLENLIAMRESNEGGQRNAKYQKSIGGFLQERIASIYITLNFRRVAHAEWVYMEDCGKSGWA